MSKKILIVENTPELLNFLIGYFKNQKDFIVYGERSGLKALEIIKNDKPDIVILDLGLDDIRGENLCTEIRKVNNSIRIIILTGDKSTQSIIECFNNGADDYVTKPFNIDELKARVNARVRYRENDSEDIELSCRDLRLNQETFEVFKGDEKINLTSKEFELLKYFMINKNRILTRDKLLNAVWGYLYEVETRAVDVHVGKLRKKILDENINPIIESVRGFGYRMTDN